MKKMFGKLLLFAVILLSAMTGICYLSATERWAQRIAILTDAIDYMGNGSGEVLPQMEKVRSQDGRNKLIIGDSVGNQIFSGLADANTDYCIATCNRAITMAGQYILAKQYIENHPDATDIYLIIILDTLETEIDITYGYQYVTIPLTETGTMSDLDQNTIEDMRDTYGSLFMKSWMIRMIGDSGLNRKLYLNALSNDIWRNLFTKGYQGGSNGTISTVAVQYLIKLQDLCERNQVELHVIPGPLADTERRNEQAERIQKEYMSSKLGELFPQYFDQIIYYPEAAFRDDIHFSEEYSTPEYLNEVIRQMQDQTGCMADLQLYKIE